MQAKFIEDQLALHASVKGVGREDIAFQPGTVAQFRDHFQALVWTLALRVTGLISGFDQTGPQLEARLHPDGGGAGIGGGLIAGQAVLSEVIFGHAHIARTPHAERDEELLPAIGICEDLVVGLARSIDGDNCLLVPAEEGEYRIQITRAKERISRSGPRCGIVDRFPAGRGSTPM